MRWSKTKERLEKEFLCPSLQGRVKYFNTRYRHAHDGRGRVCVMVDGKSVLNMPFSVDYEKSAYAATHRTVGKTAREDYIQTEKDFAWQGRFEPGDFGEALDIFFGMRVQEAIKSENLLVRMLAVLDRRTGKRTLEAARQEMGKQPEWLQFFYTLRLQSEGWAAV